jgi:hypothetical protein
MCYLAKTKTAKNKERNNSTIQKESMSDFKLGGKEFSMSEQSKKVIARPHLDTWLCVVKSPWCLS